MKQIIFILCTAFSVAVNAQNPVFDYNGDEFTPEMNKFLGRVDRFSNYAATYMQSKGYDFHNSLCNNGIVYLKFRVAADGISEVAITKNCPTLLREALMEAVMAGQKYWVVKKDIESKLLLMPVIYDFQKDGCISQTQKQDGFSDGLGRFDDGSATYNINYVLIDPIVTRAITNH